MKNTKSINYQDYIKYIRNKNIVFDDVKDNKIARTVNDLCEYVKYKVSSVKMPVFGERVVEYPLLFAYLPSDKKLSILDFGCVEDILPIHLASLGHNVTGMDQREYPFEHENFTFLKTDILKDEIAKNTFDFVISISTVEHVGLGGYKDTVENEGDVKAANKLYEALKPGGKMIITVPFGQKRTERNMRVYDRESLLNVFKNVITERYFVKNNRYGQWNEVSYEEAERKEVECYRATSPAEGVAFIICERRP